MTDTLVAGTRLAGRYEIEDVVARGRAPVYRARDVRLNREVAVKQVGLVATSSATGLADRARALREARAAARVLSPAVVQVYDVVEEPTAVWLVMELVRAPSLDRLVGEHGPLDDRRVARVGLGVLDALEAAHAQDVVHRDVRPANVLVGDLDDATTDVPVRLADFGLAALRDDTAVAAPGALSESPAYTAPEQVTGGRAGPATDLWGLGAVLYFAVEGADPFAGDSPAEVSAAVVAGAVRPPQRPGSLARIVEMLLDPRPERRPDARRVGAVLRAVAAGGEPGDDTEEAPASPGGVAVVPGAADTMPVAGVTEEAAGATRVAADGAVVAPGADETPVAGSPAATEPAPPPLAPRPPGPGRPGTRRPGRRRRAAAYLIAAGVVAALALLAVALLRGGGGDDPDRDPGPPPTTVTTAEPDMGDAPPAQDRVVPPPSEAPPETAPPGGDEPADGAPGEGDEGPDGPAPETTTTAPADGTTTTTPTTAPPSTEPPDGGDPPSTTVPPGAGTTGTAGTNGTAGTTATSGSTGTAGSTGTVGTTAAAGTTGTADTNGTAGTTGTSVATGGGSASTTDTAD